MTAEMATWGPESSTDECSLTFRSARRRCRRRCRAVLLSLLRGLLLPVRVATLETRGVAICAARGHQLGAAV